jgi:hypothetical protein
MPSLRELGLDQNPTEQPLSYPGRSVPGSCLLVGDWLYPVLDTRGNEVAKWSIELHALWLDAEQTRRMNETEPNYRRLSLRSGSSMVLLESGNRLPTTTLYAGRWGAS